MAQACIYLRLSRDDGDNVESNSIINQRSLLRDYARNHDITILYSGKIKNSGSPVSMYN
jgi:DNA invertase Pin-like site-specific DNA recombinase